MNLNRHTVLPWGMHSIILGMEGEGGQAVYLANMCASHVSDFAPRSQRYEPLII